MLPCAAFLRVYEPLAAFGADERAHWEAYAAAADRPRRAEALAYEHAEALRRMIALPPVVAPDTESEHAYVRRAGGATYICPWQTRLRSLLALGQFRASTAGRARRDAAQPPPRMHIQSNTWSVPPAWFVPFAPSERWLVLGGQRDQESESQVTAPATRMLMYVTAMAQARKRMARALAAVRRVPGNMPVTGQAGPVRPGGPVTGPRGSEQAAAVLLRVTVALEEVGRWLEEFHPYSLVELDYGGLVQFLDDDALRADQSVAEVSAAVSALASRDHDLAAALYGRVRARWRAMEAIERGS